MKENDSSLYHHLDVAAKFAPAAEAKPDHADQAKVGLNYARQVGAHLAPPAAPVDHRPAMPVPN